MVDFLGLHSPPLHNKPRFTGRKDFPGHPVKSGSESYKQSYYTAIPPGNMCRLEQIVRLVSSSGPCAAAWRVVGTLWTPVLTCTCPYIVPNCGGIRSLEIAL